MSHRLPLGRMGPWVGHGVATSHSTQWGGRGGAPGWEPWSPGTPLMLPALATTLCGLVALPDFTRGGVTAHQSLALCHGLG